MRDAIWLVMTVVAMGGCGKPVHIRPLADEGWGSRECIAYIDAFAAEKVSADPYEAALIMVPPEIEKRDLCDGNVVIPPDSLNWSEGFGSFKVDVYCESGQRRTTLKPGEKLYRGCFAATRVRLATLIASD
ncbi:MAG: hypothetical protein ACREVE_15615 [Gammaproteobacteria bacterium]